MSDMSVNVHRNCLENDGALAAGRTKGELMARYRLRPIEVDGVEFEFGMEDGIEFEDE